MAAAAQPAAAASAFRRVVLKLSGEALMGSLDYGLGEFWDDTPNLDAERGLTIPRLHDLVTAYQDRYHRQLRDVGIATALAQHDPKGLDKLLPPTSPKGTDGKWWG